MANICVKATPSADLNRYELRLDGDLNDDFVGANGEGCKDVPGECGDGSPHELNYTIEGPVGAKLTVTLFCDGVEKNTYEINVYPPGGEVPGYVSFNL